MNEWIEIELGWGYLLGSTVYLVSDNAKRDLSWAIINISNFSCMLRRLEYFQHLELLNIFELITKKY